MHARIPVAGYGRKHVGASRQTRLGDGVHYDIEVIRKRDKLYADAIEDMIIWMFVKAFVLDKYPELVELWTVARNAQGHMQRPENEVTGLTKVHDMWLSYVQVQKEPDFTVIVKNVSRGKPW